MFLVLDSISKSYGGAAVLNGVSCSVEKGELVSIVGPSGAGKTTLLKIIAGLEQADAGSVSSAADLKRNPAILVFQDYILFPTMTIYDNVAFGLRCRRIPRQEIGRKVMDMLDYFQLGGKARSYPKQLSAGQQQRVALARAMVVNPSILLLDEPFANLDRSLKGDTAEFIRAFQKEYQITTISVTHDLQEAFMMSDKIGIMLDGVLCQYDDVRRVYDQPASAQVAAFLGHVNIIPADCFALVGLDPVLGGRHACVSVRAESIELSRSDSGPGVIEDIIFAGHYIMYRVRVGRLLLAAYSLRPDFSVNDTVKLTVRQCLNLKED